jgi:polysaccharide biosynthesis protein PslG
MSLDSRLGRRALGLCLVALAGGVLAGSAPAHAGTAYVDGISDQSLPAWDGSFSDSSFASLFRARWLGQISLARYVLQWNAIGEASTGPSAQGDYRERFEAWLRDVHSLGLAPVVALSSYTRAYPASAGDYDRGLEGVLDEAAHADAAIDYVEAWNEPNNQGGETALKAAEIANWADSVCERRGCQVIAGDIEDSPSAVAYEHAYVAALDFSPRIWGIHPYHSVETHRDATVLEVERALPDAGRGAQLWLTEVGAYDCAHGELRGEARQASDASYLLDYLIPALAPAHVFYYGFMAGDHAQLSCDGPGVFDSELYSSSHAARGAAGILLASVPKPSLVFSSKLSSELLALAPSGG